jgi:hypothetical protein
MNITIIDKFSLVLVVILFLIQIFRKDFLKKIIFIWKLSILLIFLAGIFFSIYQYFLWKSDPLFKLLIPPYKSINYFLRFVGFKFFIPWGISLAFALLLNFITSWANKKYNERFFEQEEIPLGSLGIFLCGWPGLLFYILVILFLGVCLSIIYTLKKKGRAPLYYFWLPGVLIVFILKNFILPKSFLNLLIIS